MADTEASKAPEQASEEVKKPVEETKAEGKEASTAAPEEKKTGECFELRMDYMLCTLAKTKPFIYLC